MVPRVGRRLGSSEQLSRHVVALVIVSLKDFVVADHDYFEGLQSH